MTQRVLVVSKGTPQALGGSFARAFEQSGWQVFAFHHNVALEKHSRGGTVGRVLARSVQVEPWVKKVNHDLFRYACEVEPDIILIVKGTILCPGSLAQIKINTGAMIVNVFPDTLHNLDGYVVASLPLYDRFFACSKAAIPYLKALGCQAPSYLPLAADTTVHYPVQLNSEEKSVYGADVSFIGGWRLEREQILETLCDFDLAVWGPDYWRTRTKRRSRLRQKWRGRAVCGHELAKACCASKIVLNLIDPLNWPGHNMRLFETPACKAFALVTRTPEVSELFSEGQDIACFSSVIELHERIAYYLEHEEERQAIAEAGYHHVVEGGHTYVDRVKQILETI